MPHYADGSPAQVGDKVKGKPYNTPNEVVGEIVQITPGSETCNCVVVFVETAEVSPRVQGIGGLHTVSVTHSVDGAPKQKCFALIPRYDYGETKAFRKV